MVISFERYFSPTESSAIEKESQNDIQNDSVFFEGTFLMRLGLSNSQSFTDKFALHVGLRFVDLFELSVSALLFIVLLKVLLDPFIYFRI